MRVEHRLPDTLARVEDQPVVLDAVLRRDAGGHVHEVRDGVRLGGGQLGGVRRGGCAGSPARAWAPAG